MQVYDKIAAGYWTERKGEPVAWWHVTRLGDIQAFTSEPPPSLKAQCRPLVFGDTSPQVPEDARLNSERYLWLRDMASQDWINHNHNYRSLRGAAFDAAIDAARKGG